MQAIAANGDPGAFARQLDRAAQADDADAEAAPEAAAADKVNPAPSARAKSRVATDGKTAERKAERASAPRAGTEAVAERSKNSPADESGAASSDLQALLAGLMAHLPSPPSPPSAAHGAHGDATEAASAAGSASDKSAGRADALPGQALAPIQAAEAAANGTAAAATLPAFTLPPATPAPAAPAEAAPPAPVHQAQVSAAVGTPEFAPGLSAEVNVMLRDGVQEARLQLNPAEMGPITVQIQIEGSNAQIHLSAEQAPTRDALEQALPTLAGTLRDSGLTLTGGGVFEQPRQPRDDATPAPRASGSGGRGGDDGGNLVAVGGATRRLAPRGVVDLYA